MNVVPLFIMNFFLQKKRGIIIKKREGMCDIDKMFLAVKEIVLKL